MKSKLFDTKIQSKNITESSIVKKLQEFLYEKKNSSKFDFSVSICSSSFFIELHEIKNQGWKILVFDSNDDFEEQIEKNYEQDLYSYETAVIFQVRHNISETVANLTKLLLLMDE